MRNVFPIFSRDAHDANNNLQEKNLQGPSRGPLCDLAGFEPGHNDRIMLIFSAKASAFPVELGRSLCPQRGPLSKGSEAIKMNAFLYFSSTT